MILLNLSHSCFTLHLGAATEVDLFGEADDISDDDDEDMDDIVNKIGENVSVTKLVVIIQELRQLLYNSRDCK